MTVELKELLPMLRNPEEFSSRENSINNSDSDSVRSRKSFPMAQSRICTDDTRRTQIPVPQQRPNQAINQRRQGANQLQRLPIPIAQSTPFDASRNRNRRPPQVSQIPSLQGQLRRPQQQQQQQQVGQRRNIQNQLNPQQQQNSRIPRFQPCPDVSSIRAPANQQRPQTRVAVSRIPGPRPRPQTVRAVTSPGQQRERAELEEFERLEREFSRRPVMSPGQQRERAELEEFERLERQFSRRPVMSPGQQRERAELEEFERLERQFSPGPVMSPGQQRERAELEEFERLERGFSTTPAPCPSMAPEEEGTQVLDVIPCPNVQLYQNLPSQTVDVVPYNPAAPSSAQTSELRSFFESQGNISLMETLQGQEDREERWRMLQNAAENIIPLDWEVPNLDDSPLENAVMLSYSDNENWERLVDQSASILGDESLPPDYAGCLDDLDNDEDEQRWNEMVERAQGQDLGDVSLQYQSVCTDDSSRI